MITVLDKGYVRFVDKLGDDTTVVNAARVSYDKQVSELGVKDVSLLKYLATHGHTSPFRHATLQYEIYAPLMIARQWWKYVVGSDHTMDAWNESSRRYVTEEPVFYIPNQTEWRMAPENSKQGSGDYFAENDGMALTDELFEHVEESVAKYERALANGVAPEQARLFLPAYGMYVRWYWTGSLQSVAHLINQRVAHDAQKEFQEYAKAVQTIAMEHFPYSMQFLTES